MARRWSEEEEEEAVAERGSEAVDRRAMETACSLDIFQSW